MIAFNTAPLASELHRLSEKLKEHCILQLERKEKSAPDPLHSGIEHFTRASKVLEAMGEIEGGILTNARLSDLGRREEMRKLTNEYRDKVTFLATAAKDKRAAAAKLEKDLLAGPTTKLDPIPDAMQGQEIRRVLRSKEQLERVKLLVTSLNAGHDHLLRAVQLDPFVFSDADRLIPAHDLERLQAEYAKKPDDGKRWNQMETLIWVAERLEQLWAVADTQLSRYDTLPAFDPKTTTHHVDLGLKDQTAPPVKGPADKAPPQQQQFQ